MVKEKRKTRLDKGGSGGLAAVGGGGGSSPAFIGFGAFAQNVTSPTTAASTTATSDAPSNTVTTATASSSLSWSPVYTGNDVDLQMIFTRIRQKRDATTKCKALQQLQSYFEDIGHSKPSKVEATRHWIWLYHNALHYDTSAPSVRAQSLIVWKCIIDKADIPKALYTLLHDNDAIVLGMIYTAVYADMECVTQFNKHDYQSILQTLDNTMQKNNNTAGYCTGWNWQQGILTYTSRILSFAGQRGPLEMHQVLFAIKKSTSTSNIANKSSSKQQSQTQQQQSDIILNEQQQDVVEERFEKITGNVLDALAIWLPLSSCTLFYNNNDSNDTNADNDNDLATLWLKTLTSSKASLRRRTYHLVAVWASTLVSTSKQQQNDNGSSSSSSSSSSTPNIIPRRRLRRVDLPDNIHVRLSQAMAVEKEAFNWPALLEAVLAVSTATTATTNTTNASTTTSTAAATASLDPCYLKPLLKALKRALHGASVAAWGPMLLPICALLLPSPVVVIQKDNENDNKIYDDSHYDGVMLILQATWSGRTLTCGMADQWLLFQAVAEVCVYTLVRSTTTTITSTPVYTTMGMLCKTSVQEIVQQWLDVLHEALLVDPTTLLGKSRTMHQQLVRELARQLRRLEQAAIMSTPTTTTSCILAQSTELVSFFWSRLNFSNSHAAALASLVSNLPPPPTSTTSHSDDPTNTRSTPLDEKWRECFTIELAKYQQSSGQVPVSSSYQLWTSLVQHVGPMRLFNDYSNHDNNTAMEDSSSTLSSTSSSITLERFVMNDLLRWMIIHTSTLSQGQHEQSKTLVEYDFGLLRACFNHADHNTISVQSSLWEPLLREIVKAQCDLDWLVAGLNVLLAPSSSSSLSSSSTSAGGTINSADWIPCPTLDELAIQVAQESIDDCIAASTPLHHHNHHEHHHEHGEDDDEDDNDESYSHSIESTLTPPEEYERRLHFLQTSVGLFPGMRLEKRLVGEQVVEAWIKMAYESLVPPLSTRISPLLDVLLSLAPVLLLAQQQQSPQPQLQQVEQILLGSWKYGSPQLFADMLLPFLVSNNSNDSDSNLCARFVVQASTRIHEELSSSLFLNTDSALLSSKAVVWADRAWRIIQACPKSDGATSSSVAKPSLSLFGLSDIELWKTQTQCMFLATMCLLKRIDSPTDRFQLVRASIDTDETELVLSILLTLSEAGEDVFETAEVCNGKDRASRFLSALGGFDLKHNDAERWVRALVSKTAEFLAIPDNEPIVQRSVAVLALLINVLFPRIGPGLSPSEIKEGDNLWYIIDANNPKVREAATIVKAHYDSQAGYYFSIRLKRDDDVVTSQSERQTVVTRLRREQVDGSPSSRTVAVEDIAKNEWNERKNICILLTSTLLLPFLSTSTWQTCTGELVNIIVSQLGVGSDRGLGSVHYELFKSLSNQDDLLRKALDKQDYAVSETCLWKLALALGFGLNTASTSWSFQSLSLNPIPSYQSLLDLYRGSKNSAANGLEIGSRPELDRAAMAWLCVSIPAAKWTVESQQILVRILTLLFELASDSLKTYTGAAIVGVRAIYVGLALVLARPSVAQSGDVDNNDDEMLSGAQSEAVGRLIRAFAITWGANSSDIGGAQTMNKSGGSHLPGDTQPEPVWRATTSFSKIVEMAHANADIQELFRSSIRSDAMEGLSKALLDESRRYFAFELLGLAASQRTKPLREAGDVVLGKGTQQNLEMWKQDLEQDEASELEQDVEVVSQWLPLHMMESVEAWKNQGFDNDELTPRMTIGRFLTWLSVLRFIDAAAPTDFCNRPAFVSYLTRTEAVSAVLNTALLFEESINTVKGQPPLTTTPMIHLSSLVENESNFTLSKLASVVLFRTVEVLPSLSRRFWEEYCPKVYVFPLQSFLEQYIAPEILRLELERINKTSSFGEMNVSGSLVSREVTANLVQDDFTLSVLIRLPTAFPLRSAEVDCSKTFGVPPTRWKRWSLQIKLMLNNQGGTLQDALLLWKENVNQEFEGVEPCPVCYSVLHVKTHKLPALECLTCKNRFHVACLTEWFKSSGKSQCVLCQQDWKGTRV